MRVLDPRIRLHRLTTIACAAVIVGLAALVACHPGQVSELSQTDVVITVVDPETDFGAASTYAMPDQVYEITDEEADDPQWDHTNDAAILAAVARNLEERNYARVPATEIDSDDPPDLVMIVRGITAKNYLLFSWFPWYPGWGGWGGYRPWYPPVTETVPFRSGTIEMLLVDVARSDLENSAYTVGWDGTLNGVAEGPSEELSARVDSGIDQAFAQSPYLRSDSR